MKMKQATAWLPLVLTALLVATPLGATPSTVRLKARTFTPTANLEALDTAAQTETGRHHFLVQLPGPADASARADLDAHGVRLLHYVPEGTWVASMTADAMRDPNVRRLLSWAGEILPTDKTPPRWETDGIGSWAVQPDGRIELRVRLHEDADVEMAGGQLLRLGAEVTEPLGLFKGFTLLAPESAIPLIVGLDDVVWVSEGLPERVLANDGNRQITNAELLQAPPYGLNGQGVHIGIWDGGLVDANHDDFAGRLVLGESGATNDHATHVAGTFGGSGILSGSHGGTPLQWRGMSPACNIYSWNFNGNVPGEILSGIPTYDLDLETNSWTFGVNGGNCSLYGDYDDWAPEFDDITTGAAGKRINVQFAAANERDDGDCPLVEGAYGCIPPPSTAKNVITVGATNSDDDTMTGFSSWGPVDDGRLKPDVSAPGCEHYGEAHVHSTLPGDTYGGPGWCGTSMATPTVTGNLGLLYQLYGQLNAGADPEPSLIKALIIGTAKDLGNPGPDYAFGHGRIDSKAAADAMLNDTQVVLTISDGETQEFAFPVPLGTDALRFALVWHDPPANPLANPALVNNLDLVLIDPQNGQHLPWILNPSSPSQNATRGVDNLNNVEHIQVDNPIRGTWRARITGTNVPEGPQIASLMGLDLKAPGAPVNFSVAETHETSIDLTWTNAADMDREGTLIVRWQGPLLWPGPLDGATYTVGQIVAPGARVIYVADEDHSVTPFTDTGLTAGETYQYGAYTFDDMHNYSVAARTSGTTENPAGASDVQSASLAFDLSDARPNPAQIRTAFQFSIPTAGATQLRIYDSGGRSVRVLLNAPLSAGRYAASWDGRDDAGRRVAPGVYFYELRWGSERLSRQLSWVH